MGRLGRVEEIAELARRAHVGTIEPERNRMLRALVSLVISSGLVACASPALQQACPDISGTYFDASTPPGYSLASVLLKSQQPVSTKVVTLSNETQQGTIDVISGGRRAALRQGEDFVCTKKGVQLTFVTRTASAIPPLVSTSETTHYTLHKASGGSLRAYLTIETSGAAWWGFDLTGPPHPGPVITWRAVEGR
jgi:hypothetical protein